MSFSPVDQLQDSPLGLYLKIFAQNGVYNNLSDAAEIWKKIYGKKSQDAKGREHRYSVRAGYGMASSQFVPLNGGVFPRNAPSTLKEAIAQFKAYSTTVAVPFDLLDKGKEDIAVYGQPLAEELEAKGIATARMLSIAAYGDGSGALGKVASVTADATDDVIRVVIEESDAEAGRSNINWLTVDDEFKFATSAGVAHGTINNAGTSVASWKIVDKDEDSLTVTLKPFSVSNGELVPIDITTATLGATDPTAADYMYRLGTTPNDLTAISTNDYNALSEVMVGLESLTAADGRKVNNITNSGVLGGTRQDCQGATLDSSHFTRGLSKVKNRMGAGKFKYDTAFMNYRAWDALIESGETDRRFAVNNDPNRGAKKITYHHAKDSVVMEPEEFCPKHRIHMIPDSKDPLQFVGRDFSIVNVGGATEFLQTASSGSGHARTKMVYMDGSGVLIAPVAPALLVLTNFVLPQC